MYDFCENPLEDDSENAVQYVGTVFAQDPNMRTKPRTKPPSPPTARGRPDDECLRTCTVGLLTRDILRVDEYALRWGVNRSAALRQLVRAGLAAYDCDFGVKLGIQPFAVVEAEEKEGAA